MLLAVAPLHLCATCQRETLGLAPRLLMTLLDNLIFDSFLYRDKLTGVASYGSYVSNITASSEFSVPFDVLDSTRLLFMTGDRSRFLTTTFGDLVQQSTNLNMQFLNGSTSLSSSYCLLF